MSLNGIIGKIYFALFGLLTWSQAANLLNPEAQPSMYYQTLKAFTPWAASYYLFALLSAALTVISLWTLLAVTFGITWRPGQGFFRLVLAARVISDVLGHNFEIQVFKSMAWVNPSATLLAVLVSLSLLLPSYVAHWQYAFLKKRETRDEGRGTKTSNV